MIMFASSSILFIYLINHSTLLELRADTDYFVEHMFTAIVICWRSGQMLVYLLFLTRVKHCFESNSLLSLSKRTYYIYIAGIISFVVEYVIGKSLWYICVSNGSCLYWATAHWFTFVSGLSMVIDIFVSYGMLYLFISRLSKFTVNDWQIRHAYEHDISRRDNNQFINIDDISSGMNRRNKGLVRQIIIIKVLSKSIVLSLTAIISSQICLLFQSIGQISDIFIFLAVSFWAIDSGINVVCVFLSFDFSFRWYLFICKPLDNLCTKCCVKATQKQLQMSLTGSTFVGQVKKKKFYGVSSSDLKIELIAKDDDDKDIETQHLETFEDFRIYDQSEVIENSSELCYDKLQRKITELSDK